MLRTLFGVWALPSIALAGAAPENEPTTLPSAPSKLPEEESHHSAVGSSLRGATEPTTLPSAPSQLPEEESLDNFTAENSTGEVQAESLSGVYRLKNMNSGKYMVPNCWLSCSSGTEVVQDSGNSWSTYDNWKLVSVGNGEHMLKNAKGGYLSIRGGSDSIGAKAEIVEIARGAYEPAARWTISCQAAACSLRNVRSRRYLAVYRASKSNKASVVQWNKWSHSSSHYWWNLAHI